jgi:hypothetical protein
MKIHDVLAEREKTHGSFESHASLSQALKRIMHSRDKAWEQLDPYMREALDTIQHKIARILNGNPREADHWVDISGYATLVADLLLPTSKRGNNCNCKVCKESANTITGRDSKFDPAPDVYDDDIKI